MNSAQKVARKTLPCQYTAASGVHQAAMTTPALASVIDHFNGSLVAANAVGLQNIMCMLRGPDEFWNLPGIKNHHVLQSVNGFPDVVCSDIVMGEVAVNAVNSPVGSLVEPCLIFGLHDMA
jgi:hypothetical protein